MSIVFKRVSKHYPKAKSPAVDHLDLTVKEGEFIVFLGPSGCGKTTLLKMTNRLFEPSSGNIEVDSEDIMSMKPQMLRRKIGYVIQQNGLFPHMRIEDNIAVVPRLLKWKEKDISKRVDELLNMVHLDPTQFRKRYPSQLSGGQQQRVGIARAMAGNPSILLMDEPFGAIDAITRTNLQDELHKIQRKLKKTILFVTHDIDEALRLADRIVIMETGKIVQVDTPYNIITSPANNFVKKLVGDRDIYRRMNLLRLSDILDKEIGEGTPLDGAHVVHKQISVKQAFTRLVETGSKEFVVVDDDNRRIDTVSVDKILKKLVINE
jgi:osmoprotectant transport system ATP-binding protein